MVRTSLRGGDRLAKPGRDQPIRRPLSTFEAKNRPFPGGEDHAAPHRKASRGRTSRRQRSFRVFLEGLEPRIALSTFNVSTEADLRAAIASADSNNSSSNTINVTASIDLTDVAAGQMEVQNGTGTAKTLTIEGQGTSPSDTVIGDQLGRLAMREFEVVGTGTASVSVIFKDLAIAGEALTTAACWVERRRWGAGS